jgi:hypothetical protein
MNEWTVTTLKEHLDAMLAERDKQISLALTAAEKAVTKAEVATEKRFESVNEFRLTLSDQTKTFVSRGELYAALMALLGIVAVVVPIGIAVMNQMLK